MKINKSAPFSGREMTPGFSIAPSAYSLNRPSAELTVEKPPRASHTEIRNSDSSVGFFALVDE